MKKAFTLLLLFSAAACSSSGRPAAPPPATGGAAASATPVPQSRLDPNIVEETDTYVISRLPKAEYIRVDDRRIRHPLMHTPTEYFKEDDQYYYVIVNKQVPEEQALKRQQAEAQGQPATPAARQQPTSAVPLSDFSDLTPARVSGRLRFEAVQNTGLPATGMWRASFAIADVNGDAIPDIVAPAPRLGDNKLHIWLGDGKGSFTEWALSFTEEGKPAPRFAAGYGGVAVGDIDSDGYLDVVCASHGSGLVSLFGDGKGGFRLVRTGLPRGDFSAQAVTLLDADGDGKLDLVASRDVVSQDSGPVDKMAVRVYTYRGEKGWENKPDGIVGGFYSNSLTPWDFDLDGRKDVLTGSHYIGALTLLWKSQGDGTFSPVSFDAVEVYAYHFATAPGTFGKEKAPAFADAFLMTTNVPENARATGITLYAFQNGAWTRNRIWRKKSGQSLQSALAMGDLDGDGFDDIVFADSDQRRLRVFFQQPDGAFVEMAENEEPLLDSPGQCVRLADLDRDGRLDIVLSKTVVSGAPQDKGGWNVYRNRAK